MMTIIINEYCNKYFILFDRSRQLLFVQYNHQNSYIWLFHLYKIIIYDYFLFYNHCYNYFDKFFIIIYLNGRFYLFCHFDISYFDNIILSDVIVVFFMFGMSNFYRYNFILITMKWKMGSFILFADLKMQFAIFKLSLF